MKYGTMDAAEQAAATGSMSGRDAQAPMLAVCARGGEAEDWSRPVASKRRRPPQGVRERLPTRTRTRAAGRDPRQHG